MREFVFSDELERATFAARGTGLPTEAAVAAKVGGARRNRTDDLLLAKQALSQLSYGPSTAANSNRSARLRRRGKGWWAWEDLNFRPHAYQARALTN